MIGATRKCVLDIETEALHPVDGGIICIGIMDVDTGKILVFYDTDEEQMLRDFVDYFSKKGFQEIIGYNVLFDIRYIFARLLKYNINSLGMFRVIFTDLMSIMKSVRSIWSMNRPGTLQEWSAFLFGEGKLVITSVADLYQQGLIDRLLAYNKRDVEITYCLWKRITEVLTSNPPICQ